MQDAGILHTWHAWCMVLIGLGTRCLYTWAYSCKLILIQDRVQGTSTSMHACLLVHYEYGMMLCINIVIITGTFTFILHFYPISQRDFPPQPNFNHFTLSHIHLNHLLDLVYLSVVSLSMMVLCHRLRLWCTPLLAEKGPSSNVEA